MKLPATKIVCTIGPASDSPPVVAELIRHGMSVARFNFSHGKHETHARAIEVVREEARRQGRHVAILQDLQGPKIRLGRFGQGRVVLKKGADFTLTTGHVRGDETVCGVDYRGCPRDVRPGGPDPPQGRGRAALVRTVSGVTCGAVSSRGGGGDRQGVNLPDGKIAAFLDEEGPGRPEVRTRLGVDYVALSFVRSARRPGLVRAIRAAGKRVPVIAKLEKPQALRTSTGSCPRRFRDGRAGRPRGGDHARGRPPSPAADHHGRRSPPGST
jgi:pyruvate kinase